MNRLGIAALVLLASCATSYEGQRAPFELPPNFGPVAWTTSPADVVATAQRDTSVVWVGKISDFTYVEHDDGLEMEWVCESLPIADPGSEAIRRRPISVGNRANGRFLVNLVQVGMTDDTAKALKHQYEAAPHYVLVAGTVDAIVDRNGIPTVFLYTKAFELSESLVTYAQ